MTQLPLLKESIQPRLDGIMHNVSQLKNFGSLDLTDFQKPEILERVHYHLRLALEGVFNITAHILSRKPGARETEYKRMAIKLGELGIVDQNFAEKTLTKMAGYRNRLTHFYSDVKAQELYSICKDHLSDIETFLSFIKALMSEPEQFGFKVE